MSSSRTTAEPRALSPALATALLVALWAPASSSLPAAPRTLHVQGRVLSPAGGGQAGWPVDLIATQRYVEIKRFRSGGNVAVIGRTVTDAQGYFRFELPRERKYQFWFLRFSRPAIEDPVLWELPADLEITRDARRDRVAAVQVQLRHHADWPEVQRRVAAEGGETSERGRILRTLGLPEKEGQDPVSGGEEWWYFTRGVMYSFASGGAAVHRFEPVLPRDAVPARKGP